MLEASLAAVLYFDAISDFATVQVSVSMVEPSDERRATREAASAIPVGPETSSVTVGVVVSPADEPSRACSGAKRGFGVNVSSAADASGTRDKSGTMGKPRPGGGGGGGADGGGTEGEVDFVELRPWDPIQDNGGGGGADGGCFAESSISSTLSAHWAPREPLILSNAAASCCCRRRAAAGGDAPMDRHSSRMLSNTGAAR
jgi:hypothetical protein